MMTPSEQTTPLFLPVSMNSYITPSLSVTYFIEYSNDRTTFLEGKVNARLESRDIGDLVIVQVEVLTWKETLDF